MQYNLSGFNQECLQLFRKTEYSIVFNKAKNKNEIKRTETRIVAADIYLLNWFVDLWFSENNKRHEFYFEKNNENIEVA